MTAMSRSSRPGGRRAELRGTVLSQDATTLRLERHRLPGRASRSRSARQTIPVIPLGTPVEARVTLGPDPANPAGIVLTLVSLHVEAGNQHGDHEHGDFVKAEGTGHGRDRGRRDRRRTRLDHDRTVSTAS